jgi:DNA-binding LacI/PurR family transcriptional regulator
MSNRKNNSYGAATLTDVARAAGVSHATVAQVYRGQGRISERTRQVVLEAGKLLKFQPNPYAQRLAQGGNDTLVGLFSLNLDMGVGSQKVQRIQRALQDRGFLAPIHGYGNYDYHAENHTDQVSLMGELVRQRPKAIVCATSGVRPDAVAQLQRFLDCGGLVVCFGYHDQVDLLCDQVTLDDGWNMTLSARHLVELGHRRIGLFVASSHPPTPAYRDGFGQALADGGIAVREDWIFHEGGVNEYEEGGAAMARRLAALPKDDRPTGLCMVNDFAAQAFVTEALRLGLNVPGDISVVGFDDTYAARHGRVPLTTVSHPVEDMADTVMHFFDTRLDRSYQGPPRNAVIRGRIVQRESAGRPNTRSTN